MITPPSPATIAAVHALGREDELARDLFTEQAEQDLAEARTVRVGKTVLVARGRKVPRGTMGEVLWSVTTVYGTRVQIAGPDGDVWTAAKNVDVLDPENYLGDWTAMVEDAADIAIVATSERGFPHE